MGKIYPVKPNAHGHGAYQKRITVSDVSFRSATLNELSFLIIDDSFPRKLLEVLFSNALAHRVGASATQCAELIPRGLSEVGKKKEVRWLQVLPKMLKLQNSEEKALHFPVGYLAGHADLFLHTLSCIYTLNVIRYAQAMHTKSQCNRKSLGSALWRRQRCLLPQMSEASW